MTDSMKNKKITIADIAKEAGTSISTVSYVINSGPKPVSEKTRNKILEVIERCSYSPDRIASSLKRKSTMSIGVIFPNMTNIYFPETLGGILEATQHENYNIILKDSSGDMQLQEDCIRDLISMRVDGLIIRPISGSPFSSILEASNIPFVVVDRREGEWKEYDYIAVNNKKAVKMAAEILFAKGHKNIALITGPRNTGTSMERVDGFKEAIKEKNLDLNQCRVLWGDYSVENGKSSMAKLFNESPDITGVIAGSTRITFGLIDEIRERENGIPNEIDIVAYGYSMWLSLITPSLTIIEQQVKEVGRRAVKIILKKLKETDKSKKFQEVLDPVKIDGVSH